MSNVDNENRWRKLAAQIAIETDRAKLTHLIRQLCETLELFRDEYPLGNSTDQQNARSGHV
jgi:hypothetical protein